MEVRKKRATPENGLIRRVRTAQSVMQTAAATSADARNAMRAIAVTVSSVARNAFTRESLSRAMTASSGVTPRDWTLDGDVTLARLTLTCRAATVERTRPWRHACLGAEQ